MTKIFLTGGSSFLGESFLDALAKVGEVVALEHNKPLKAMGVKVVKGSMDNISEWENNLNGVETIVHLAGITHTRNESQYSKINTLGTIELVEACEKAGVKRFIFISTRALGKNCGAYGQSKKKAEEALQKSKLEYVILRVGEAYNMDFSGKEGLSGLAGLIKKNSVVPYFSDKNIKLSPIHRDDVRDAILSAVDNPKAIFKTYTLAGPESLSTREVEKRIAKHCNLKRTFLPIPTFLLKIIFFFFSNVLKKAAPDQLERLLSEKEPLSGNVLTDLGISPRKFLQ